MKNLLLLLLLTACATNGIRTSAATKVESCEYTGIVYSLLPLAGPHAGSGYTVMLDGVKKQAKDEGATDIVISDKSNGGVMIANSYKCKG